MAAETAQIAVQPVHPPLALIPVGLKEAALDSPTFRATAVHFSDNIDAVERWLEGYLKAASKLVAEVSSLEVAVNSFLAQSTPPSQISEAVLDHDYTLLALQRYGENSREFWQSTFKGVKRYDASVIEPIKSFLNNEMKSFKEARRAMDSAQKSFDGVISRYSSQSKTKEASSLREDAFQLHEARKIYLRSSMDFCVQAPQLRASLDKLIVRTLTDQWKEMRTARDSASTTVAKWNSEMERVKGWSKEMENSERAFKRELLSARKQIEDSAEQMTRPSRELEGYSASTVPYLGGAASSSAKTGPEMAEKQGWLFLRSVTGKPARTLWLRRWFFVKNGIFGWLMQGTRSGGVEESEKIGVLLCGIRPAFQEERRFCFEVKTKDQSIVLQAETQQELTEWIHAFEIAKRKALEDPASTDPSVQTHGIDPAFAISPPIAPELAVKAGDGHTSQGSEELGLTAPERDGTGPVHRASFDVSPARRVISLEKDSDNLRDGSREPGSRLKQKLEIHKRSNAAPPASPMPPSGGIASLISASHNILPVGPGAPQAPGGDSITRNLSMPSSSLAPSTLAAHPSTTNLSHTAVVVTGERGLGVGRADGSAVPSGILGNVWGSSNWGYVNRLGEEPRRRSPSQSLPQQESPSSRAVSVSQDDSVVMDGMNEGPKSELGTISGHRKNMSVGADKATAALKPAAEFGAEEYPISYPLPLKAQNAQFRMLFPSVPKEEKLVLVFRATWNPNDQQEFPGRVYVTAQEIYFFSNHLGLVLITGVSLISINDVTAAPGRDCDFIYLHLKDRSHQDDPRRITVKIFLESMRLLQRRLNYLVANADSDQPANLEEILQTLIKMEVDEPKRSLSIESWEDISYDPDDTLALHSSTLQRRRERNVKASLRIDGKLYGETIKTGREIQKFKLPAQPVVYAPQGMQASFSRDFPVSAKALFHVMFGDKSAVFQLLYAHRWTDQIVQTPWTKPEEGHWTRKFTGLDQGTSRAETQTIDVFNDHLCYVVTTEKSAWRLPYTKSFHILTKFVTTHSAKSRCKLAVCESIVWTKSPPTAYFKRLVEQQVRNSLGADAIDLASVAMDQVAKLGNHSKTNKAVDIFGSIGQQTQAAKLDSDHVPRESLPAMRAIDTQPVSISRLVVNDLFARLLSFFDTIFDVLLVMSKGIVGLCTGHTLLVGLLITSAFYNSYHSYRDGTVWYRDRSASKFMKRLGVSEDTVLHRTIHLHEIDALIAPPSLLTSVNISLSSSSCTAAVEPKTCRSTFLEHLTSPVSFSPAPRSRLHRTRMSLARHRHDLLVALRVVNRVEEDVVRAEWEDWVRGEAASCDRVDALLSPRDADAGDASETEDELGEDFAEYCRSCRAEIDHISRSGLL